MNKTNRHPRTTRLHRAGLASAIALLLATPTLSAQEAPTPEQDKEAKGLDQVIVTGTRRAERTVLESNVPVDVVSKADLQSTFATDINTKLQSLVPSYSVRRLPTNDGAIFVRPAALRNLSPDHTLVLINGKRFHRSAFVDVTSRGAQAVNLALIPAAAFKRVEVLRDGAAAQYGSDAIAGVINFVLDDQPGTSGYVQYGEYSEGDGENLQIGLATGFRFGEGGHFNIAAEHTDGNATSRGTQRAQAALIAAQGEPYASAVEAINRDGVVQRYGLPDQESTKLFFNAGYDLDETTQLYAFGNFADTTGVADFNYRGSLTVTGPDANGNTATFSRNGGYSYTYANGWTLYDLFPGGFTPRFGQDDRDWSFVAGIKGVLGENLDWNLSASTGSNRIDYWLDETVNLSLGEATPTSFDAGSREQREQNLNLDFVYVLDSGLERPVNIGFGLEHRREEFRVNAGEEASWVVGPYSDLSPASNGFPGAHPETAGSWGSRSTSAYVDFDFDLTDRLNVNFAGRYEDFSLFGSTFNGKVAARFAFTDALAIRGAVSSGFRAPTPGQQNLYNVSQNPNTDPLIARSVDVRGQLPSNSVAAAFFGGEALDPEKSINASLGLVYTPTQNLSLTVDAYNIEIEDRIGLSQSFELTEAQRAQLVAASVPFAGELTHVSFYTNAFDTRTSGVDVVAAWRDTVGPGQLGLTWASNYNYTELTYYDPALFNEPARVGFLRAIPRFTSNLTADYELGKWKFTGRARHFGEWVYVASSSASNPIYQDVGAETFFDLIGTYRFSRNVDLTLGVENLFDNYSDEAELVTVRNNGRRYPGGTPYENDGRLYYARLGFNF